VGSANEHHPEKMPRDPLARPAAVLFDLYDTLIHARADGRFFRVVPAVLGIDRDRWLACYRSMGRAAMLGLVPDMTTRVWRACLEAGYQGERATVAAVVRGHMASFYSDMSLDPQAVATLDALRGAGLRLALVSNAAPASGSLVDALGLRARLDAVVMSFSVGALKPDPAIYLAALDAIGARAEDCAFVGDGRDGELGGARRLGLRTVLIDRGLPHTDSARADADQVCADLADVAQVLLAAQPV
jgi:putative hydrolase of the HAD superfamily